MISGADISADGVYRYHLWRVWSRVAPRMVWIMLNPSTADAEEDDPTIRRCMGFARREGYGAIDVLNLFAFRSTEPATLVSQDDPVGPENQLAWQKVIYRDSLVVAAWGAGAYRPGLPTHPDHEVLKRFRLKCLGMTRAGYPRHPLYVRGDQPLIGWP